MWKKRFWVSPPLPPPPPPILKALPKKPFLSRWAWSFVWGDSNDEWKYCQLPTFDSIWKASKLNQRSKNYLGLYFQYKMKKKNKQRQNYGSKRATGEERSDIKGNLGYVAKPKTKTRWWQKYCCAWTGYIFRRAAPSFLNQVYFCNFQGWKNRKTLPFREFFAGNNSRDYHLEKCFAGI